MVEMLQMSQNAVADVAGLLEAASPHVPHTAAPSAWSSRACITRVLSRKGLSELEFWRSSSGPEGFPRGHRTHPSLTPVASYAGPPSSLQTTAECPVLLLVQYDFRGIGTGISEASKRVPIFPFATQGGKQASSYFRQRNWVQAREA